MAATQFNTRIDKDIKAAGDEAFAALGLTPSRVVQATWGYAARNRHNKKKLHRLVEFLEENDQGKSTAEENFSWVDKGPALYREMLTQMGIEEAPQALGMTDDELLFEAMRERAQEKGMAL